MSSIMYRTEGDFYFRATKNKERMNKVINDFLDVFGPDVYENRIDHMHFEFEEKRDLEKLIEFYQANKTTMCEFSVSTIEYSFIDGYDSSFDDDDEVDEIEEWI